MTKDKRVPMSKPNGSGVTATANVLPEHVEAWEAKGWSQDTKKTAEGGK